MRALSQSQELAPEPPGRVRIVLCPGCGLASEARRARLRGVGPEERMVELFVPHWVVSRVVDS